MDKHKILGKENVDNKALIVNEASTIREELGTRYKRKGTLGARPHPIKAPTLKM